MKLEYVESLILAHPFIKGFDYVHHCISEVEVRQVAEGRVSEAISRRSKADIEGIEEGKTVHTTTFYIGLLIEPKQSTPVFSVASCSLILGARNKQVLLDLEDWTSLIRRLNFRSL